MNERNFDLEKFEKNRTEANEDDRYKYPRGENPKRRSYQHLSFTIG
jgi:hypothetical protein